MGRRMPFGKHVGRLLTEIDSGYLAWLVNLDADLDWRHPGLRAEAEAVLRTRDADKRPTAGPAARWEPTVERWYREMALKYHPHRGGSTEVMQALNDAHDRLRKMLAMAG